MKKKDIASKASATLRSKNASAISKSFAGSVLSKSKTKKEQKPSNERCITTKKPKKKSKTTKK